MPVIFDDIFKLEKIDMAHLLYSITMLANENIPRVIDKIRLSGKNDLDVDKYGYAKKYPHYFEPGITDFKKFGSVTRKLNRNR